MLYENVWFFFYVNLYSKTQLESMEKVSAIYTMSFSLAQGSLQCESHISKPLYWLKPKPLHPLHQIHQRATGYISITKISELLKITVTTGIQNKCFSWRLQCLQWRQVTHIHWCFKLRRNIWVNIIYMY